MLTAVVEGLRPRLWHLVRRAGPDFTGHAEGCRVRRAGFREVARRGNLQRRHLGSRRRLEGDDTLTDQVMTESFAQSGDDIRCEITCPVGLDQVEKTRQVR